MNDGTGTRAIADESAENVALTEEVRQIANDARTLAQAEIAYQKARGLFAADKAKSIAILGAIAAGFAFFALMAAVVGSVIALGPVLGLWGAMAAVTLALLAIVAFCGLLILLNVRELKSVLSEPERDDDEQTG